MQIWIPTNNRDVPRGMKTKFPATVMVSGVLSSEGYIMPPHIFESRLESQHQSVPGCAEECGDPLAQSGGRWQTLGVAAGPQVQRDPGLASEGVLRLCTPSLNLLLPRPEPAGRLRLVIRREHHQHDLTATPKPAWSPPSAEYSPCSCRRLWKRHALSSGCVSRRWLSLKAATLNRCQLYYIIKLPELIFFNKSLKIKLQCCFLEDDNFIVPPCSIVAVLLQGWLWILNNSWRLICHLKKPV